MKKFLVYIICLFISFPAFAIGISDFVHEEPLKIRNIEFSDEQGNINSLNDFRGKVVLLNFWATWCMPCVEEMPAFVKLKESLEGREVEIIPISIDYKGIDAVRRFYTEHNITSLPAYLDEKGKAFRIYKLRALPTSIIIDKEGRERARIMGEIDWNSEESLAYLIGLSKE